MGTFCDPNELLRIPVFWRVESKAALPAGSGDFLDIAVVDGKNPAYRRSAAAIGQTQPRAGQQRAGKQQRTTAAAAPTRPGAQGHLAGHVSGTEMHQKKSPEFSRKLNRYPGIGAVLVPAAKYSGANVKKMHPAKGIKTC
jgi:hypothetical protein